MFIQIMGVIMLVVGIMIIMISFQDTGMFAIQIMILGSMFFGLGIIVISLGIMNKSINENRLGNSFSASSSDPPQPKDEIKPSIKLTAEELEKKLREHVTNS